MGTKEVPLINHLNPTIRFTKGRVIPGDQGCGIVVGVLVGGSNQVDVTCQRLLEYEWSGLSQDGVPVYGRRDNRRK